MSEKMTEHKLEFGADFRRWLTAKIVLTCLVLAAVGGYMYHRILAARAQEAEQAHEREFGIEGTPILVGMTADWLKKKDSVPNDPGLKLTDVMIKSLDLRTDKVVPARVRPLPPQIGTLNYDNETMFLIKCRFNGELVSVMKVKEKVYTTEPPYEKIIERPLKFGDKVKQGDVLAVFWSVALGTAKAAFVDAISAVRLSQATMNQQMSVYDQGALPLAVIQATERQLRGDNNNLLTAERSLRMWRMTDDEIAALRKEANEILDSMLINPTGRIIKIDDAGITLVLSEEDKQGKVYKFAKNCKFFRVLTRYAKQEIKEGVKADAFQRLGKRGIGAMVATNTDDEVTEILVGKERDVLDEVNRWARTEVYIPWFDKGHPDRELTVVEKNTNIGDIVDNTNFGTWLFRVADMSKLQIWVHPAEEYLPLIREGMKTEAKKRNGGLYWEIRMQSDPDAPPQVLPVDLICPSLEPNQHNPMVVGYLPNKDHKYLVGQFVTATIMMPPEDNTAEIPTTAINEYNGQSFIFVKDKEPGTYSIRRVAVVRRYADYSIVRTELREQDKKFSADEVKEGRYPLRSLRLGDLVVTHGAVEMTTALENLITKETIKLQRQP